MSGRFKEEEKNEKIIRTLLKLADNKKCINCNSLVPQYVCTTFRTFVCTNCSGIHREYTHRVKSISMAKFTSQEVTALKEGGNQRAKDVYFKGLDQQRQSVPDGSNVELLRDFIRQVYVNKRYTNEKNDDKPPRGPTGESETRSSSGSRSPQYEDTYDRRSSPGGRSPGFEQGNKKSPSRPEVLNDWRREDRFGGRKKSEEESHSPEQVKDSGSASPPPVLRPVREILGDSVIPLRVIEPPKPQADRNSDAAAHATKPASSLGSLISRNENPPEVKLATALSLIDFDADPEPPAPAPQSNIPASTNNDNWASFDAAPIASGLIVSQSLPNGNTVDSLLSQLTALSVSGGPVQPPKVNLQPLQGVPTEVRPSGRTELSADLFAVTYPSYHAAVPGWHAGTPHGMHYGMQQYANTVPFQNVPQTGKSVNPFDFNAEPPSQTQTETMFPSMASLQVALPPSGMMPSQGVHNHFSIPSQVSGHPSSIPPSHISPQIQGNIPPSNVNGIGNMGAPYETQQTYQNFGDHFAAAVPSNSSSSFPLRGNPFG